MKAVELFAVEQVAIAEVHGEPSVQGNSALYNQKCLSFPGTTSPGKNPQSGTRSFPC
jgi:hypothetical protein